MTRKISICRRKYKKHKNENKNINKYSISRQSLKIILPKIETQKPPTTSTLPIKLPTTITSTKPTSTTTAIPSSTTTTQTTTSTKPTTTTTTQTTTSTAIPSSTTTTQTTTSTKPTTTTTQTTTSTKPTTTTTQTTTSTKPTTTQTTTTQTSTSTKPTTTTIPSSTTKPTTPAITNISSVLGLVSQSDALNIQNQERQLKNLNDFTWSDLLEKEAINWATNLTEFNNCGLTHYLDTARGQNLYALYGSTKSNINNAINAWVDEKNLLDKPNVTFNEIGHYLTIISPDFTQVGCGIAINPIQNCLVATCNYS